MENTVTISLKEYDELREFKARMEEDKIMIKLNTKPLEIELSKLKAELEGFKNAFEKKKPWYKKLF